MNLKLKNNICKISNNWYLKKINFLLIQKYELFLFKNNFLYCEEIQIGIKTIVVSDEDILLKNILLILEIITGKKAIGFGIFKYIGSTKKFFFNAQVCLRKKNLMQFVLFFSICCIGIYYKRNGINIFNIKKNLYNIVLTDYNIFPNYNFINIIATLIINFKVSLDEFNIKFKDYLELLKIK